MLVKDLMSTGLITVKLDSTVGEAMDLMRDNNVRHLPVLDEQGNFRGLVSESDILEKVFPPRQCITQYQFNLLCRTPITRVMNESPIIIGPEETIEEAALLLQKNKISGLPVVKENKILGIISEVDIIGAFINALGLGKKGCRITIPFEKKWGQLSGMVQVFDEKRAFVEHMVTFENKVVFKITCEDPTGLVAALEERGFTVSHLSLE